MLYTQGKTDCKPGEVGYNEQRLDVLNGHLQRLIDDGEIQCATYCISRRGKIFAHGAVGKKSFRKEDDTPVQPDKTKSRPLAYIKVNYEQKEYIHYKLKYRRFCEND